MQSQSSVQVIDETINEQKKDATSYTNLVVQKLKQMNLLTFGDVFNEAE